jgi:thiol-disulfide isomerase/thioredoxin
MARLRTHRRALAVGVVLVLVAAALAIGLAEGGTETTAPDDVPTLAQAREDVAGAPAPLARLYAPRPGDAPDAPSLTEPDRDAFEELLRGLRGRPVVVNVWYPKCAPCVREFPILRTAAARYGTRVAFLGVATDGSRDEIAAFLRGQPTVYPHVRDPTARIARPVLRAGNTYPSTVLIDAEGAIVDVRGSEYTSLAQLEGDLRAKLGVGPVAGSTTTTRPDPTR